MDFANRTPFPALAFEGIDQYDQAFHVVVLRQTLSFAAGQLVYADEQAPLCEVDTFFGEINNSSVRQESDLCQYKPRCDVIVNATAHAPRGIPVEQFDVHLRLTHPGLSSSLSTGNYLNPGATPLLEKSLRIVGERTFQRQGLLGLKGWVLTRPMPFTELPLRYEYAFGGQCRIDANDPAARQIPEQHRLTREQMAQHPARDNPPAAHSVWESNIVGTGYVESWYLDATKTTQIVAPRIEHRDVPVDAGIITQSRQKDPGRETAREPAGFGIRFKAHPARRSLLGTVDEAFIASSAWLPADFDFSVWNAAPLDQQVEHLLGDESITLVNLCRPGTPSSRIGARGDTVLELTLPGHECHVLIRMMDGLIAAQPMAIDTLLIEPEALTVTLVWRTVLAKRPDAALGTLETRMRSRDARMQDAHPVSLSLEERAHFLTRSVINRILPVNPSNGEIADE